MTNSQELVPHAFGTPEHAANRAAIVESISAPRLARHRVIEEAQTLGEIERLCSILAKAGDMLPRQFRAGVAAAKNGPPRTEEQAAARLMVVAVAGQPFGWDVLTSIRMFDFIDGTPKLKAEAALGLIRAAGHTARLEHGPESATFAARNTRTGEEQTATWDRSRAEATPFVEWVNGERRHSNLWAKWLGQGNASYMLRWRAISEVSRFLFSDLMFGMASDEADEAMPQLPSSPALPAHLPVAELAAARRAAAEGEPLTLNAVIPHQLAGEEQFGAGDMTVTPADTQLPQPGDLGAWRAAAKERGVTMSDLATWATGPGGISGCHTWTDAAKLDGDDQAKAWGWLLSHEPKTVQA